MRYRASSKIQEHFPFAVKNFQDMTVYCHNAFDSKFSLVPLGSFPDGSRRQSIYTNSASTSFFM